MKSGDWYENQAGTIYKIKSCRRLPNRVRIFNLGKLGSSKDDQEINEFQLSRIIKSGLLRNFRKWGY